MRRSISVLLLIGLCVMLCACESVQTPVPPEVSRPNSQPGRVSARLDELPDYDYEGRSFRIAVYQADTVFPENTETLLDKALQKRNDEVEEKFHVKLKNAGIAQETFFSDLRDAYDSGKDVCDIVVAPRSMASSFLAADMLLNVNSLPYTNYNKTYFDTAAMNAASVGSVTYELAGDFTVSPESQWAVCYNIPLMEWFGFTDFVTLARGDQWTWELFNIYVNWFYKDKNGDRIMTDQDLFGCTSSASDEMLAKILWASSGIEFFENDPPHAMQIDYDDERTEKMIQALKTAMESPGRYAESKDSKSALELFLNDQSLFYICPSSMVGYLQLQGKNVGMLPLPKLDEKQEHFYSYVDPSAPVVYVLNNCVDTEFVGRVVQGLFAASENIVVDTTVQVYGAYHLTGNAAVNFFIEMLEHAYYDPAFVLGESIPEIKAASWGIIENCVFLKGDFEKLYEHQELAFNETFADDFIHSYEDGIKQK